MDSLTQITLGAAVGEAVLGRRVGNRAMLWGAVGGTLPDIDTVANLATGPISALAYHRAISHSFLFALVVPPLLGWVAYRIYDRGGKGSWLGPLGVAGLLLIGLLVGGALALPMSTAEALRAGTAVGLAMLLLPLGIGLWHQYRGRDGKHAQASWSAWTLLLFLAIVTHPLLDSCTTYGTQLFQPFSDLRVAWNNISVVDPAYTLPFLICVLITLRLSRGSSKRRWVNRLGLGLSTAYLLLTAINKWHVNTVFEASLAEKEINYHRYMTAPTLFNNLLWQATAEGDSSYYYGYYSLLDRKRPFFALEELPKNHHLLKPYLDDRDVQILRWFSNGYYALTPGPDGKLIFNDMRFGRIKRSEADPGHFVFKFVLEPEGPSEVEAYQEEASRRDLDGAFAFLWNRILGR